MGIITRKKWDNDGIGLGTILFLLFPSALTLGAFAYETATATPLIEPETAPTLAGFGIEYLWVIFALITVLTAFIWVAFGRAKPRT